MVLVRDCGGASKRGSEEKVGLGGRLFLVYLHAAFRKATLNCRLSGRKFSRHPAEKEFVWETLPFGEKVVVMECHLGRFPPPEQPLRPAPPSSQEAPRSRQLFSLPPLRGISFFLPPGAPNSKHI